MSTSEKYSGSLNKNDETSQHLHSEKKKAGRISRGRRCEGRNDLQPLAKRPETLDKRRNAEEQCPVRGNLCKRTPCYPTGAKRSLCAREQRILFVFVDQHGVWFSYPSAPPCPSFRRSPRPPPPPNSGLVFRVGVVCPQEEALHFKERITKCFAVDRCAFWGLPNRFFVEA